MRLPIIVASLLLIGGVAHAGGSKFQEATPQYRDEGRDPVLFSTNCVEGSWNVMVASDSISRSFTVYASTGNTSAICISTTTKTGDTCSASRPGIDLLPGGAWTDFTTISWTCRSYGGTMNLKGYRGRDRGDYGIITPTR